MTKKLFFACLYALNPSQHLFNHFETIFCLLRLNQYLAADKAPWLGIENSDSTGGESQTSKPSISNQMLNQLSHCTLPKIISNIAGFYDMMAMEQLIFNFS